MHVGTRDPEDRIRPSGERLLEQRHRDAGREQRPHQSVCAVRAARERTSPDAARQADPQQQGSNERRTQHVIGTHSGQMHRLPLGLCQSQQRYTSPVPVQTYQH